MDFRLTEEQELLRRSVREFAETEIRPHVMEWDQAQHFPVELVPQLASLGLLGIQIPEKYGGAGMSASAGLAHTTQNSTASAAARRLLMNPPSSIIACGRDQRDDDGSC